MTKAKHDQLYQVLHELKLAHIAENCWRASQVDPENRLIAATLERKWEQAMDELERARNSLPNRLAYPLIRTTDCPQM